MNLVAIKTPEQMDLLALHRVRSRLVGQRTGATALRSARQRQRRAAIDCIEAEY
jgi:transposase